MLMMASALISFTPETSEIPEESKQLSSYVDATLQGSNSNCGWIWSRCGISAIFYTQTIPPGTTMHTPYRVQRVQKQSTTCWEYDVISVQSIPNCIIWWPYIHIYQPFTCVDDSGI